MVNSNLVNDGVLRLDWLKTNVINTKKTGFKCGCVNYGRVGVCFWEGGAFVWVYDNVPLVAKELIAEYKEAIKTKDMSFPEDYEHYLPLVYNLEEPVINEQILNMFKLAPYRDDIIARAKDISNHFKVVAVPYSSGGEGIYGNSSNLSRKG